MFIYDSICSFSQCKTALTTIFLHHQKRIFNNVLTIVYRLYPLTYSGELIHSGKTF